MKARQNEQFGSVEFFQFKSAQKVELVVIHCALIVIVALNGRN